MRFKPPEMPKPQLRLATIGQEGHGKTTLASAIFWSLAARGGLGAMLSLGGNSGGFRHAETQYLYTNEESRGPVFIEVSQSEFETPTRHYTLYDCSAHLHLIRAMLVADAGWDGLILVVDPLRGLTAQALEQLRCACATGQQNFAVFLNRRDPAADSELLALTEREIREAFTRLGLLGEDIPIVRGSALRTAQLPPTQWDDDILGLMDAVETAVDRPVSPPQPVDTAPHRTFSALVYLMKGEEGGSDQPFPGNSRPQFHFGAAACAGTVTLAGEAASVAPGQVAEIAVELAAEAPIVPTERFSIRAGGRTIAIGAVQGVTG